MIQWWNTKRQWPTICRVNPTWPVDGTALEKGGEKNGQFPQVPVPKKKLWLMVQKSGDRQLRFHNPQTVVGNGISEPSTATNRTFSGWRQPQPSWGHRWTDVFHGHHGGGRFDPGPSPMHGTNGIFYLPFCLHFCPKNPPFMLGKYTIVFRSVMRDVTGFTMGFIWKRCRSTTAWKGTKGTKDIYIHFIVL